MNVLLEKVLFRKTYENLRSRKRQQNNYEIYFYTEKRNRKQVCQT